MIPIEDLTYVTLAFEDTDADNENDEDYEDCVDCEDYEDDEDGDGWTALMWSRALPSASVVCMSKSVKSSRSKGGRAGERG